MLSFDRIEKMAERGGKMLNTEGKIGKLRIKNRFVMPPLVTNFGDEEGYADFIAFGRQSIADPEFPEKMIRGDQEKIRVCGFCNYCLNRIFSGEKLECLKDKKGKIIEK